MIANKTKYTYTKHAKDEWIRDEYGFIRHYPKTFILTGCKSIKKSDDDREDVYVVTYRYCDRTDLVLVVKTDGTVITNYRSLNLGNKTNFNGIFYLQMKTNRVGYKKKRSKIK